MGDGVPSGFEPYPIEGGFDLACGMIYRRETKSGSTFGFPATERHGNLNKVIHGGMLMTFADNIMGLIAEEASGRFTATISLNVDFVASTTPDGWVEGRPTLTRLARTVAFLSSEITSGGKTLITASGVWRIFEQPVQR